MPRYIPSVSKHADTGLFICALLYCLCCFGLGAGSRGYAELKLPEFSFYLVVTNLLWLYALYRTRANAVLPDRRFVLMAAVLFRLILLPGFPVLENDIYRYLWDGYMLVQHHAVYGLVPEKFYADPDVLPAMRPVLDLVAYPEVPTVYGPFAELVFAISYLISPAAIWPYKLVIFSAEIALLLLLAGRIDARKLLLFSWCPLPLVQYALNVHVDVLAITFTMAAVCFNVPSYHKLIAPMLLVLACACKIFALFAVPFILHRRDQRLYFIVMALVIYAPVLLSGHSEFDGLLVMARQWAFNSFWYTIFSSIFGDGAARVITAISFLSGLFLIYRWHVVRVDEAGSLYSCFFVYALLILTMPAVNPWYLGWLLVFALFTPYIWPWVFAVTIWLALLTGINLQSESLGLYEISPITLWLEYGMVVTAMLWDLFGHRIRQRKNTLAPGTD